MIHHVCRIKCDYKGVSIFFFGDKQAGQKGYNEEAWQAFRDEFKSTPNAYAIGLGDYLDWLRPSMRVELLRALAKDDSARKQLDAQVMHSHDKLIKDVEFLKGRTLLLHEGHHNWTFASGQNTDQRLAEALGTTYGGWIASTRVVLDNVRANNGFAYTILSTHGNANARRVPATVTWMEQNLVSSWDADQYVMGHGCKNANFEPHIRNRIRRAGPPGVSTSIPRCMVVGGFSQSYTNGWESDYVERNGFAPQPIGWGVVRLKIRAKYNLLESKGLKPTRRSHSAVLDVEQVNRNPMMPQ